MPTEPTTTEITTTDKDAKELRKRTRPTLVQVGTRLASSDGRWHPDLAADYIVNFGGRERWMPVSELAKVFFSTNTQTTRKQVRRRLYRVWHELLDRGRVLVVELGEEGAQACKIYDPRSREERQYLQQRLERMEKLKMLRVGQLERAIALAAALDEATGS